MNGLMKMFSFWFAHLERMENNKIAKRVYAGECADIHSVGNPKKKWIDTIRSYLKKVLDVRQTRRMLHDKIKW